MVKKPPKTSAETQYTSARPESVKDSARQIWLAGLGAFSKAHEEGNKVFETLVKEGLAIQRKTQAAAEEKISEANTRMAGMANEIQAKAGGQRGKLEGIFEARVARAMDKLGIPSASTMNILLARIDAIEKNAPAKATVARSTRKPTETRGNSSTPLQKPLARPVAKKPSAEKTLKPTPKLSTPRKRG